jgi:hypothetical protein
MSSSVSIRSSGGTKAFAVVGNSGEAIAETCLRGANALFPQAFSHAATHAEKRMMLP